MTTASLPQTLTDLDELWSHVSRAAAADLKALPGSVAVPTSQVHLLRLLDRYGSARMSELASYLGISMGGCTGLVDRALEAGLVERRRDADDRRVVWVAISPTGEAVLAQVRQARAEILTQYLQQMAPGELDTLADLLRHVAAVIQQEIAPSMTEAVLQS